jgi:hypothetical protein
MSNKKFIIFMEHQHKIYNYNLIDEKALHKIKCDIRNMYNHYLINVIEVDENNKPIGKTLRQYRFKPSRGRTISEPIPLEYFYYKYPELAQNYLVHIIDNNIIYVKYFNYIVEAYEYMKNKFLEYLEYMTKKGESEFFNIDEVYFNTNETDIDFPYLINKYHKLAFGEIEKIEKIGKIDIKYSYIIYEQNKEKSKDEIITLFNNGFLSNNLTFIIDKYYFDIKLINNNKNNKSCIICGDNNTKSYNKVSIEYNKGSTYEENATFFYCEKHYPNMII